MDLELYFKQCIANKGLSHAYALWGWGRDEEKTAVAHALAGFLETGVWAPMQAPVDCMALRQSADEESMGIAMVREARRFLWQKPVRSAYKMLIVLEADGLTREAQNAFLKIIEEPQAQGLILFIMRDPAILVPALQSRFQKIYIAPGNPKSEIRNTKQIELFLKAGAAERKEIIKQLVEGDAKACDDFCAGLMAELHKDPLKQWRALRELSHRIMLMNQFSTNRRLQLEAISSYI